MEYHENKLFSHLMLLCIMPHIYAFEKLDAWKECRLLAKEIYKITLKFPDNEKFGMVSQMRRSAISVCSNLAEGSSRTSSKDQAHFYQLAYSILMELLNQLIIAGDLKYVSEELITATRVKIELISRLIASLRKSRLKNPKPLNP